jgi:hypothetical protein
VSDNRGVVSRRLVDKVRRDFSPTEADTVLELLDESAGWAGDLNEAGRERIQAAIVLAADGDSRRLLWALALADLDWRDVLLAGGLAEGDWLERLAEALRS